ncbi:hypothetical protein TCAL_13572 [Tigriopus californicus]|uniref:Uncharacterized protein n=1 Tax=Tigriopus californicus TaxID=6832 RepID=A0A553PKY5_TIGCA|nr:uncharacterized protein LOC131889924 [Tigriopus californicus]TRY78347.1 hypothetical protein TCAL_13572 [Tigriopus californicus]|eukprot:TCALIF_13572-PA protein Name:"Protein of unknown function" AED:0.26 eAED:0.26 QI:0/1/0/1/1/1/3/0/521
MNNSKWKGYFVTFVVIIWVDHTRGQYGQFDIIPNIVNTFGENTYVKGIKNVMGGVLGADKVHQGCIQRTLCKEFAGEVIETTERYDPVKRTLVRIPRIVQRRGRLRWIGDAVMSVVKKIGDRLNINPYGFKKRQGGVAPNLVARVIGFAIQNWNKIPIQQVFHVMDMTTDATNVMSRKGAVYPFAKSAALGYGYGDKKADEFDGVCSQVAPDCGDWWSHLKTANEYEGAALPRKTLEKSAEIRKSGVSGAEINPDDPLVWGRIKPEELLKPKVLLCKTGLFLEKLNENMGGEGVVREKFSDDTFDRTCQETHVNDIVQDVATATAAAESQDELPDLDVSEIQIIDARNSNGTLKATETFGDLPILVLEGLPEPNIDQTEEDLVEEVLKLVNISETSVRTALRLPVHGKGKSLVLVELDTSNHREQVIEHKDELRTMEPSLVNLGIRRAKYRELWSYVKALTVVQSVNVGTEATNHANDIDEEHNYEYESTDEEDFSGEVQVIDAKNDNMVEDNDESNQVIR